MSAAPAGFRELDPADHSRLLCSLADVARRYPLEEKLLICPRVGVGRELLHSLSLASGGWIGFRVKTPLQLATELVADELLAEGLTTIDDFESVAMIDEGIDDTLEGEEDAFAALSESVGFREAIHESISALRRAGIGSMKLATADLGDRSKRDRLAAILARYEGKLSQRKKVDESDRLRMAVAALTKGGAALLPKRIYLVPGLSLRGAEGKFLQLLLASGAQVLTTDPVFGLAAPSATLVCPGTESETATGLLSFLHDAGAAPGEATGPDIELFAAASPLQELREVLRRVIAAGLRWDEVEIIATDPLVYHSALDALAGQLGIPVTYASGLPLSRTRIGQAVAAYLRWITEDFEARTIQTMVQAGLLAPPAELAADLTGPSLAVRLGVLEVAWGRDRYVDLIDRALERSRGIAENDEGASEEEATARRTQERKELVALRHMLSSILAATPPTPDRFRTTSVRLSPAAVARGIAAVLDFVPVNNEVEGRAKEDLDSVLQRIIEKLHREAPFAAALAVVERHLDRRVPASVEGSRKAPWSAAGGMLHMSGIDHGGLSGRKHTFVVGLDAGRFPKVVTQDPLLTDQDRAQMDSKALSVSGERLEESNYELSAVLARLRGKVTFSFSGWDSAEGRNRTPAALMLQAFRLVRRDSSSDYEALAKELGGLACAVPTERSLDTRDVWLGAFADGPVLCSGRGEVRQAFPGLDRGFRAQTLRFGEAFSAEGGSISPRPELLDPRRNPQMTVSATRLETLGRCPLRYLHRYVLEIEPPPEPPEELGAWLDARERGSLLHDVYESLLRRARRDEVREFEALLCLAEEALAEEARRRRRRRPPPSEAVFHRELDHLLADLEIFVKGLVRSFPEWIDLELGFGFAGETGSALALEVPGGKLRLRGRVDRVDEAGSGDLLVVDYKTGRARRYSASTGVFDGGRRLQHALYSSAVELLLGRRVARMEYEFPTRAGEGQRIGYSRSVLEPWSEVVTSLLELVAAGDFVPTDEPSDCRYCDYQAVCRVVEDDFGVARAPAAEWAKAHVDELQAYEPLLRVRRIDERNGTA